MFVCLSCTYSIPQSQSQNKSTWFAWRFVHINPRSCVSILELLGWLIELRIIGVVPCLYSRTKWLDDDFSCFFHMFTQKNGEDKQRPILTCAYLFPKWVETGKDQKNTTNATISVANVHPSVCPSALCSCGGFGSSSPTTSPGSRSLWGQPEMLLLVGKLVVHKGSNSW